MDIVKIIEEKLIKIGKMIGIIFVYYLGMIALANIYRDCLNSSNMIISYTSNLLIYLLDLLIISLFFIPTLVDNFHDFKKKNIKVAFKNWGLGFICMLISNLYLIYFVGNMATNEASNRSFLTANPIVAILLMSIVAPALEEIVFRLNIKKAIKNKYIFCIISGLLFGGMHLLSASSLKELLFIIPYGSLGFFFAKAYYETDNIYTSIIMHMFHNSLSIFFILLGNGLL